jgi:EAL domain-containing protein (putative c-di-GMP-specific phosphodiesterase class I)
MYSPFMGFPRPAPTLEAMIREELSTAEPGLHMGVVFEEIIDLRTNALMGHEVLTRVASRPSVHVTPETWFAKARSMGVVAKLEARAGELALRTLPTGDGMISVNFSPDCLETPEVISVLDGLAELDRIAVIELSEHHHVAREVFARSLAAIRDRGLLVAVDDAGTGESGPEFIKQVSPDVVKIDRKHVCQLDRNASQRAFLRRYVELTGADNATIVTEGVANSRLVDAIRDLGTKWGREFLGQGHWLSKSRAAAARLAVPN